MAVIDKQISLDDLLLAAITNVDYAGNSTGRATEHVARKCLPLSSDYCDFI